LDECFIIVFQESVQAFLINEVCLEAFLKLAVLFPEFADVVLGCPGTDDPLVGVFVREHDIRDDVGIPVLLALFFDKSLGEDVMDVLAGSPAQPVVADLDVAAVEQVLRPELCK